MQQFQHGDHHHFYSLCKKVKFKLTLQMHMQPNPHRSAYVRSHLVSMDLNGCLREVVACMRWVVREFDYTNVFAFRLWRDCTFSVRKYSHNKLYTFK